MKLKKCPKCKKKTLETSSEAMKGCGRFDYRTRDEWSLMNAICKNPKCGYIK